MKSNEGVGEQWSLGSWTVETWGIREVFGQATAFAKDLLGNQMKIESNNEKSTDRKSVV